MFLEFAENGMVGNITVNGLSLNATSFMDNIWNGTQCLWNGKYYNYNIESPAVECEMGNFAQIIDQYQNFRGSLPYFGNVVSDLENTLLTEGNSNIWVSPSVIQHMIGEPQERLGESLGSVLALQMLYPDFSANMQNAFGNMIGSGMWQNLVGSSLYANNQFTFYANINDSDPSGNLSPEAYTDDASLAGTMLLFLDGIIPQSGSLAIGASNERYQDYQTCFPTSRWQFNFTDQTIRVPVTSGDLGFIFGSHEVTQNFPTNGVYDIQFSADWNSITQVTKIADITLPQLKPAILQTQIRPTSAPTFTPTSSTQPTFAASNSPIPTGTPTQVSPVKLGTVLLVAVGAGISSAILILLPMFFYVKKREKSQKNSKKFKLV